MLDPPKTPVPGGNLHPLTRYVMNYLGLISDYEPALVELIATSPSARSQFSDDDPAAAAAAAAQMDVPELENQTPLAAHLTWIIAALHRNLENKANLYKDDALSHLFFMNNLHYIVRKVKASPELRAMISDEYLRRLKGRYRQLGRGYQRAAWARILHCLRDEGMHAGGKLSSGVSMSTVRERFRAFNAAFEEVHRTQAMWVVPDAHLREELRISISEMLVPAYRGFLGRYRQHVENGSHPGMYIKYSVEDLELALSDLFEGSPAASANNCRRRFR